MTGEPKIMIAGNSYQWRYQSNQYKPIDHWQIDYSITNKSNQYPISSTIIDSHYQIILSSQDTAQFKAGNYQLVGFATRDNERHIIYQHKLIIKPDPALAIEIESWASKALSAIEAAILTRAATGKVAIAADGKSVSWHTLADLDLLRSRFKREVAQEQMINKMKSSQGYHGSVRVRLS